MKMWLFAALLLSCIAIARSPAYASGPKYKKPDVNVPQTWESPFPWQAASPSDSIPKGSWWTIFGDAELNQYEERAIAGNQTLKAADSRLSEARSTARVTAAGLYPELDAGPSVSRQRYSANRPGFSGASVSPNAFTQNVFSIPFTLNYEIDLFGRVRHSLEASNYNLQASAADLENVRLMITAELAADYFQLRELDAEIAVVRKAVAFEQDGLKLVEERHSGGAVSGLDVAQQQTVLESSLTQLSLLQRQRAQYEHAIALLQGQPASDFKAPVRALAELPPAIPLNLPSELLQRRPDIATAERQVAAANAQIGVARAAFYPSLPLTGGAGFSSRDIASLVTVPSAVWSIGLAALEPLIAGGRNRARLQYARAAYDECVADYRESALVAFQQVEDALSGLNSLTAASDSQQRAVAAANQSLKLANARYSGGIVTYLDVITAQEQALAAERLAAQLFGQRMVTSVYLVKALGGGWNSDSIAALGIKPSLKQAVQQ